jgi:NAD(P)H-hydrate epimerase
MTHAIVSVAEMRAIEERANANGLSYAQMMNNAGEAAAKSICDFLTAQTILNRSEFRSSIVVLCGPGNNGGDGLVCARTLKERGADVQVFLLKQRGDNDAVFVAVRNAGVPISTDLDQLRAWLSDANVIVDALLGTGISRPIEGELNAVLRLTNDVRQKTNREQRTKALAQSPIFVALDGVTGMNYDTGALDPAAVPADVTITFHAAKRGHFCFPAAGACGELIVADIGIGKTPQTNSQVKLADEYLIRSLLPVREPDANKGTHGKALVIGGCEEYMGAPSLSAKAAYRIGAGLVAMAVPQAVKPIAAQLCPEAIFVTLHESNERLNATSLARVTKWLEQNPTASVLVGPGISQVDETANFLLALLASPQIENRKLICDADALNILSKREAWHKLLTPNTIVTPHAGEMSRLAKQSIDVLQADRIGNALKFAELWGHIVVMKGAHTVIASPECCAVVLPFANPAMATAGTGDVLAGCILGMLSQGLSRFDAAVCGAYLHGAAGEIWRKANGVAGMLASDLLLDLPKAIQMTG